MIDPTIRMLNAMSDFQTYADMAVHPRHALESAAKTNEVDSTRLALLLVEKLIGAQRARAALAGMAEGDES
jgi:hypothetical protein